MNLPDEKREALTWAVANEACIHTGGVDPAAITGCRDCQRIADALAPLLAGWLAEAERIGYSTGRSDGALKAYTAGKRDGEAEAYSLGKRQGAAELRARVEAVLTVGPDAWTPYDSSDTGETFLADSVMDFIADIRAALDTDAPETTGGA